MLPKTYYLSPSSFAFLWEECKSCFWSHVVQNFKRPMTPFPAIFSTIDAAMKTAFQDGWHSFGQGPKFSVVFPSRLITSAPIVLPGRGVRLVIRGAFDSIIRYEDSNLAVVDFKTAFVKDEYSGKYGRQLHAYAYTLDHPATGSLSVPRIQRLGLGVFEPDGFALESQSGAILRGKTEWVEVGFDEPNFTAFLDEVATLLEQPTAPPPNLGCPFCQYRVLNALKFAS